MMNQFLIIRPERKDEFVEMMLCKLANIGVMHRHMAKVEKTYMYERACQAATRKYTNVINDFIAMAQVYGIATSNDVRRHMNTLREVGMDDFDIMKYFKAD